MNRIILFFLSIVLFIFCVIFFILQNDILFTVFLTLCIFLFNNAIFNETDFSIIIIFTYLLSFLILYILYMKIELTYIVSLMPNFDTELLMDIKIKLLNSIMASEIDRSHMLISLYTILIAGIFKNASLKNVENNILKQIIFFSLFTILVFFMLDDSIKIRDYKFTSDKISSKIKIVQLSDTHNEKYFFEEKNNLEKKIREENPDLIFITGDIFDKRTDFKNTITLINRMKNIAPIYYVTGNHEYEVSGYKDKIEQIESLGIIFLKDDFKIVNVNNEKIIIGGLEDPIRSPKQIGERLMNLENQIDTDLTKYLSVLLSHRPEKVYAYNNSKFEYIYTGHSHGGQIRIPFLINGIYAPAQGFFPKYVGGLYELSNNTKVIVNRGLKKTGPVRIFNPPEIIVTTFYPE